MSTPCTAIQGNADFYGQGIRIGVYLQWLSAWISILTETSSAQPVLEVSSVFVFAILIATITSYSSGTIQPIETYIMLQFAFGFFVTTMGIFGVRLQVLSPHGALHLLHELKEAPDRIKKATVKRASRHVNTRPRLVEQVQHFLNDFASIRASLRFLILLDKYSALLSKSSILSTVQVNLNSLAFLKLRALTWSGVLWRANVVAMLAGFNIVYWFSGVAGGGSAAECRPVIFMVAKVTLESGIVTFYKFTAIAAAILIFPQAIFLMAMAVRLCVYLTLCAHRDLLFRWRSDARERALNRLQNAYAVLEDRFPGNRPDELPTFLITAALAEQKIRTLTRHSRATATGAQIERPVADAVSGLVLLMMRALEQLTDPLLTFNVVASLWPFRNIVEYWEFLAESDAEMIHFSDILKLFASLASTVVDLEPDNIQAERGRCAVEALPENTARYFNNSDVSPGDTNTLIVNH